VDQSKHRMNKNSWFVFARSRFGDRNGTKTSKGYMTKQQPNAGGQAPLHLSTALAGSSMIQQNEMECQPASRDGSETSDVATMDDVQFSASLDRLLDSELADSAFEAIRAVNLVSADPSVSSSASSRAGWRGPQQLATPFSVPPAASLPKRLAAHGT
jgi:hypothetical protein